MGGVLAIRETGCLIPGLSGPTGKPALKKTLYGAPVSTFSEVTAWNWLFEPFLGYVPEKLCRTSTCTNLAS